MTISRTALAALQPRNSAPANVWATHIAACWRASVEAILEVGRLLTAAKESLPHGAFGQMIELDLPFTARTAQMLMAISADPRLTNPKHVSHLPPSWGTLYELTKLDDEQFERGVKEKIIRPDMERKGAPRAHMAARVQAAGDLDYSPTPPWATRVLFEHVLPAAGDPHICSAWEPACGEGHIAEVLHEYVAFVRSTDIHDYGYGDALMDFLDPETRLSPLPDLVCTNPPFEDRVLKFMLRGIELSGVVSAMFLQLRYLEGIGRYNDLFRDRPPTIVAPFVERVPLLMGQYDPKASTTTAFMWLVWVHGEQPKPTFWIPPGQREALTRPDDAARFTAHPVRRFTESHDPHTGEIIPSQGEAAPV